MAADDTISDLARGCLRLQMAEGVGPIRFRRLVEHFGGVEAVLVADAGRLRQVQGIGSQVAAGIARASRMEIEAEVEAARSAGVRIVSVADADYPRLLRHVPDAPICLYVKGRLEPGDALAVAVVGSRRCSYYGREQAEHFGSCLARAGLTVVSGLARGVDAAAQRAALATRGRTIAVMGCGLAHVYPPEHAELAEEVAANGALVSELAMDVPPDDKHFPPRNRIIAGLSLGVLVVEATRRSGALITASLAQEYDREVFAVPGRIDAALSAGPNSLIRDQTAKLVAGLEDILTELGEVGARLSVDLGQGERAGVGEAMGVPVSLSDTERRVLEGLGGRECAVEELIERVRLGAGVVASTLTLLQLKACVRRLPSGEYAPTGRAVR